VLDGLVEQVPLRENPARRSFPLDGGHQPEQAVLEKEIVRALMDGFYASNPFQWDPAGLPGRWPESPGVAPLEPS